MSSGKQILQINQTLFSIQMSSIFKYNKNSNKKTILKIYFIYLLLMKFIHITTTTTSIYGEFLINMNNTNNNNNNNNSNKSNKESENISTETTTTATATSIEQKLLEWIFYIIYLVIYKLIISLYKNLTIIENNESLEALEKYNADVKQQQHQKQQHNINNNYYYKVDDQQKNDKKCAYFLQLIITGSDNNIVNLKQQQHQKYLIIFYNNTNNNNNNPTSHLDQKTSTSTTNEKNKNIDCHFYCCGYCYCNCQLCCCLNCRNNHLKFNCCFFLNQRNINTENKFDNFLLFKTLKNIYKLKIKNKKHNEKHEGEIKQKTTKIKCMKSLNLPCRNRKIEGILYSNSLLAKSLSLPSTTSKNFFSQYSPYGKRKKLHQQQQTQQHQFYISNHNYKNKIKEKSYENSKFIKDERLKCRNLCKFYVLNQQRRRRRRRRHHLCCYFYTTTTTTAGTKLWNKKNNYQNNKCYHPHQQQQQQQRLSCCYCNLCGCCFNLKIQSKLPHSIEVDKDVEQDPEKRYVFNKSDRRSSKRVGEREKYKEEKRFLKFIKKIFIYIIYKTILINKTTIIAQRPQQQQHQQQQYIKKTFLQQTHEDVDMNLLTATTTTQSQTINRKNKNTIIQQQQYEHQHQLLQHRYKNVIVVVGKSNLVWLFIGLVWFKSPKVVNCLYYQQQQQQQQRHNQHQQNQQQNQQQQQQQQHILDTPTTTNNQNNIQQQPQPQQKLNITTININITEPPILRTMPTENRIKIKKHIHKLNCENTHKNIIKRTVNEEQTISWDILQREVEMEEKSDRDRLESIKNQILTKLGLTRKPNITHSLPKQFVWDTIYRANGLNIMEDFETMIKNQSQHSRKNFHQVIDVNSFTELRRHQLRLKEQQQTKYYFNDVGVDDHDEDYIGSTQEIILFAENGHKNLYHQGLVEFAHPKSQQQRQQQQNDQKLIKLKGNNKQPQQQQQQHQRLFVSYAELHLRVDRIKKQLKKKFNKKQKIKIWIFQLMDKEILTTIRRNSKTDINEFAQLCASFDVNTKNLGWQKIDLTTTVRQWFQSTSVSGSGSELKFLIDCSGCGDEFKIQLIDMNKKWKNNCRTMTSNNNYEVCGERAEELSGQDFNANRPFLVLHTEMKRLSRVRRRAIDCSGALNGQCCKESFYVSFKALGWDDWIIAPRGYFANYCRGDCTGPYRTPDTFQTFHAHFIEEYRKMGLLNGMNPCCAPIKFSSMSLIYYGDDGIIKRDLPKMVVDECGCP